MNDLVRFAAYLEARAVKYAERIHDKALVHSMPLRVEATAALMAGIGCLRDALIDDGEVGTLRNLVNECVSHVIDAGEHADVGGELTDNDRANR